MPNIGDTVHFWGNFYTVFDVNNKDSEIKIGVIGSTNAYGTGTSIWHSWDPTSMRVVNQ